MSAAAVLAANRAFYEAFSARDLAAMDAVWAQETECACVHPGWGALLGREPIMASWSAILSGRPPTIRCVDPVVRLLSATVAFVVCAEVMPGGRVIATNTFVLEDGAWKLVHHHASPVAEGAPTMDDDDEETDEPDDGPGRMVN
jgi:hypothetical protein